MPILWWRCGNLCWSRAQLLIMKIKCQQYRTYKTAREPWIDDFHGICESCAILLWLKPHGSCHEWHVIYRTMTMTHQIGISRYQTSLGKASVALHCGLGCHCCADPCALHLVPVQIALTTFVDSFERMQPCIYVCYKGNYPSSSSSSSDIHDTHMPTYSTWYIYI